MRIYLDNCCFNRPFDDQQKLRIFLETKAKLAIQEEIRLGKLHLIWSFILNFEISQIKSEIRKSSILDWQNLSTQYISAEQYILEEGSAIQKITGIKAKDALHLASAFAGNSKYFITTDDEILAKCQNLENINVVNPIDFLKMENRYEN